MYVTDTEGRYQFKTIYYHHDRCKTNFQVCVNEDTLYVLQLLTVVDKISAGYNIHTVFSKRSRGNLFDSFIVKTRLIGMVGQND